MAVAACTAVGAGVAAGGTVLVGGGIAVADAGGAEVGARGTPVAGAAESDPQAARANAPMATAMPIKVGLSLFLIKPNGPP